MSEKPPRQPALPPSESSRSGSLSASPSPQQDPELQWLEPLLQELRRGISGNTRAALTIAKALGPIAKSSADTNRRSEEILREILLKLGDLVERIEGTVTGLKVVADPIVDARNALNAKAEELGVAVERIREASGRFPAMQDDVEDGPAPRGLKKLFHHLTDRVLNFAWPHAKRAGVAGVLWFLKLLAATSAFAGLAKILSVYIKHFGE